MKITQEERWELIGLLTLAYNHHNKILELEQAIADLLEVDGSPYMYDMISESVWSEQYSADELLEYLDIEVEYL